MSLDEDTLLIRAGMIFRKVKAKGSQQVRLYKGHIITYCFPAPRSYGTRGILIAVYTPETPYEWIEDDLLSLTTITHSRK